MIPHIAIPVDAIPSPEGRGLALPDRSYYCHVPVNAEISGGCDITVILPHYACAPLLTRAIESIVAQTHTRWFLVIVDDGSPHMLRTLD